MTIIEFVSGPSAGASIEAKPGESIEVGRTTLARLGWPQDAHMSARHFAIACTDGRCDIRDLGSTNGTFVNGTKISEARLNDGDRIQAGRSIFVVRLHYDDLVKLASDEPALSLIGLPVTSTSTEPALAAIPVLQLVNETPFAVTTLRWSDLDAHPRMTIVVKATFVLGYDVRPTPRQLSPFNQDIMNDKQPGSVRFESDLVPFKPCTDVVLVGRAHAPEGKPVTEMVAGVRVGPVRAGIAVVGDRRWESQLLQAPTISHPEPFLAMDLVYERAFGGIDAAAGMYCKENLVGTGFIGKKTVQRLEGLRLPNLEDPRNLIGAWNSWPRPVGFGFYGRGWAPRLAYAGTYDEPYMKTRHPLPPADFSYRFFNGAHPDLQAQGYLRGDEEVDLLNVCADAPRVHFRLPGIVPRITVSRWTVAPDEWIDQDTAADDSLPANLPLADESLTAVLDTVVFVPDQGVFYEVFRGVCALSTLDSAEVARITVTR